MVQEAYISGSSINATSKMELFVTFEQLKNINQFHKELHLRCYGDPRYAYTLLLKRNKRNRKAFGKKSVKNALKYR